MHQVQPRIWRSRDDRKIAGVLGGLAERFNMDSTFLRVLYVFVSVFSAGFPGLLIYVLLWIIAPLRSDAGTRG